VALDFMSISNIPLDDLTKAKIVYMILNKMTEEALEYLSNLYNMVTPKIVVNEKPSMRDMFKKKVKFMQ
jgi:hypothetical protein